MKANQPVVPKVSGRTPEEPRLLSSWKDIADYLGRGIRTVQRWEQSLGLPVRRPTGAAGKSTVALRSDEVDNWLATRFTARPPRLGDAGSDETASARAALRERVRTAYELRTTNQALTRDIQASIRLLAQQCDRLSTYKSQSLSPFPVQNQQAATAEKSARVAFRKANAGSELPEASA